MSRKDMSDKQFLAACERHGIDFDVNSPFFGFGGYVHILHNPQDENTTKTGVSVLNAGTNNKRKLLAWLIGEAKRVRGDA